MGPSRAEIHTLLQPALPADSWLQEHKCKALCTAHNQQNSLTSEKSNTRGQVLNIILLSMSKLDSAKP